MSQTDQFYWARNTELFAEGLDPDYQVCLCSPHPSLKIVILSASRGLSDRFPPRSIIDAANRAVSAFKLNPTEVVWVEHLPASPGSASYASFQLIQFDWQAERATNPRRLPIYEGWYLSWLQGELYSNNLRQALESILAT